MKEGKERKKKKEEKAFCMKAFERCLRGKKRWSLNLSVLLLAAHGLLGGLIASEALLGLPLSCFFERLWTLLLGRVPHRQVLLKRLLAWLDRALRGGFLFHAEPASSRSVAHALGQSLLPRFCLFRVHYRIRSSFFFNRLNHILLPQLAPSSVLSLSLLGENSFHTLSLLLFFIWSNRHPVAFSFLRKFIVNYIFILLWGNVVFETSSEQVFFSQLCELLLLFLFQLTPNFNITFVENSKELIISSPSFLHHDSLKFLCSLVSLFINFWQNIWLQRTVHQPFRPGWGMKSRVIYTFFNVARHIKFIVCVFFLVEAHSLT